MKKPKVKITGNVKQMKYYISAIGPHKHKTPIILNFCDIDTRQEDQKPRWVTMRRL